MCKFEKPLYGLKQSGRNWNKMLHDYLCENNFVQNPSDHCGYCKINNNEKIYILIWVDDPIIATSNENVMNRVKEMLKVKFKMKDLEKLTHFLGIDFEQTVNSIKMSQSKYVGKILERFNVQNCKPRATPCEVQQCC